MELALLLCGRLGPLGLRGYSIQRRRRLRQKMDTRTLPRTLLLFSFFSTGILIQFYYLILLLA